MQRSQLPGDRKRVPQRRLGTGNQLVPRVPHQRRPLDPGAGQQYREERDPERREWATHA
jgi:hypothetical protein